MSLPAPGWWQFAMLALAAFRVYRLIARDTITEPVRAALTYPDDEAVALGKKPSDAGPPEPARPVRPSRARGGWGVYSRFGLAVVGEDAQPKSWRVYLSTLIRCPWCAGFYVSAGWWLLWSEWPRETMFAAAPWAISAVVALAAKLDA